MNCNIGSANPKSSNCTFNCGNCNCTCDPPPNPDDPDDPGGGTADCVTTRTYSYSAYVVAPQQVAAGYTGAITVSGSTTSDTRISPLPGGTLHCVTIPVSVTSFTISTWNQGVQIPCTECSLSPSSVQYGYGGVNPPFIGNCQNNRFYHPVNT